MKKLAIFFIVLGFVPVFAFAKVQSLRTFPDPLLPSKMILTITAGNYEQDINCGGLAFWGVQAVEHGTGERFLGSPRFVSSATLTQEFLLDLPSGEFEELMFVCSGDGENEAFQYGSIENDLTNDQVIFHVSDEVVVISEEIVSELTDGATVVSSIDEVPTETEGALILDEAVAETVTVEF